MTEFKCLKAVFILNFFMEACAVNNLQYIIQKTMSPRKSQEDVMIKFYKS